MRMIELPCPDCGELNSLQVSDLANGREIACQHCANSLLLAFYRETSDDPPAWHLESRDEFSDMETRA